MYETRGSFNNRPVLSFYCDNSNRFGFWFRRVIACTFLAVFLIACQPAKKTGAVKSTLKNDFSSGVSAVVDYASNPETKKALLVVDVTNQKSKTIQIWMDHRLSQDGSETMKRDRIYTGNAKFISRNFRLKLVEAGITETIVFQVSDTQGARLLETEPIINTIVRGGTK